MTFTKTLTGAVLASAVAMATFSAVPARANDNDVANFVAGAAAGAILMGALNNNHHDHYTRHYYTVDREHYDRGHSRSVYVPPPRHAHSAYRSQADSN